MKAYERSFMLDDIKRELGVDKYQAIAFLKEFGIKCGGKLVISQAEFRHMQLDGRLAEWIRHRPREAE